MTSSAQPKCGFFISSRGQFLASLHPRLSQGTDFSEGKSLYCFLQMNLIAYNLFLWFVFRAKDRFH